MTTFKQNITTQIWLPADLNAPNRPFQFSVNMRLFVIFCGKSKLRLSTGDDREKKISYTTDVFAIMGKSKIPTVQVTNRTGPWKKQTNWKTIINPRQNQTTRSVISRYWRTRRSIQPDRTWAIAHCFNFATSSWQSTVRVCVCERCRQINWFLAFSYRLVFDSAHFPGLLPDASSQPRSDSIGFLGGFTRLNC